MADKDRYGRVMKTLSQTFLYKLEYLVKKTDEVPEVEKHKLFQTTDDKINDEVDEFLHSNTRRVFKQLYKLGAFVLYFFIMQVPISLYILSYLGFYCFT